MEREKESIILSSYSERVSLHMYAKRVATPWTMSVKRKKVAMPSPFDTSSPLRSWKLSLRCRFELLGLVHCRSVVDI